VNVRRDAGPPAHRAPKENGKGDAYAYCKACHPGAIERRWTRDRVLDAMRAWQARYGRCPSSYDWSRTRARQRGGEALDRLEAGEWPPASVVSAVFGSWAGAHEAAGTSADALPRSRSASWPGVERSVGLERDAAAGGARGGAQCAGEAVGLGAYGNAGPGVGV
jgi:hypothetical protein